jgi:hypothetical protein
MFGGIAFFMYLCICNIKKVKYGIRGNCAHRGATDSKCRRYIYVEKSQKGNQYDAWRDKNHNSSLSSTFFL